eukprot:scaffold17980_cov77-Isochrysis_galbana.AAC.4
MGVPFGPLQPRRSRARPRAKTPPAAEAFRRTPLRPWRSQSARPSRTEPLPPPQSLSPRIRDGGDTGGGLTHDSQPVGRVGGGFVYK